MFVALCLWFDSCVGLFDVISWFYLIGLLWIGVISYCGLLRLFVWWAFVCCLVCCFACGWLLVLCAVVLVDLVMLFG